MPVEAPPKPFNQVMAEALKDVDAAKLAESGVKPPPAAAPKEAPPAPKPAAEIKPNAVEDVDREIVEGRRKPYAEDFKRVKHAADEGWKKAKELEPKVQEYEKELAELRKQPKHNAEMIKQLTDDRDRYKGMFEQVAVEISPEFHAKYKTRLESVKSTLPPETADKLMSLLQLPDSEMKRQHLSEMTSDMNEFQVAEIVAANRDVRSIINERQSELNKAQESLSKIGEERNKKQQEHADALGKAFEETVTKAKVNIPVFQSKEGDDTWNKGVNERLAVAKAIFSGDLNDTDKAEGALWAAAAPTFLAQLKQTTTELEEAKATIAKMQGSNPQISGQGAPNAQGRKLTFAEKVAADMKGGG